MIGPSCPWSTAPPINSKEIFAMPATDGLPPDVTAWLAEVNGAGMFPHVGERVCYTGLFARLAIPFYLDATPWVGPFDTERDALLGLHERYSETLVLR
jgi:hypothetical protein